MVSDMAAESRIGASLAALREDAGLTPEQLARLSQTPVATVVGIERGAIEPPAALVARLTAAIAASLLEQRE